MVEVNRRARADGVQPAGIGPADDEAARARSRLLLAWLISAGAATIGLAALLLWLAIPESPERFGLVEPLAVGRVEPGPSAPNSPQHVASGRLWLVETDAGWLALRDRSPHLGCKMRWNRASRRFVDPCHGQIHRLDGSYERGPTRADMQRLSLVAVGPDGEVLAENGPAGRPLRIASEGVARLYIDLAELDAADGEDVAQETAETER